MDQRTPEDLYQAAVQLTLDVVSEVTSARGTVPPSDLPDNRLEKFVKAVESKIKFVFWFAVVLFAAVISCGLLGKYFRLPVLTTVSAGMMALLITVWIFYFLAVSIPRLPGVIKFLRAPYEPVLKLVKHAIEVERSYLDRLAPIDADAVEHVLAHFKNERRAMEQRGSALSGSIDRLGLFPALGAVALLYYGLKAVSVPIDWIRGLVSLIVIFHMLNFMMIGMYQRLDRIVVMLERSVATRD